MNMEDDEIKRLGVYLDLCSKKQIMVETVWLAFRYHENHRNWNINKCFEHSIWDVLISEAKKETKMNLKETIDKINQIGSIIK